MFKVLFILWQCIRLAFSIAWSVIAQLWRVDAPAMSPFDPGAPSSKSLSAGHELSDAKPMLVALMAAALIAVILTIMGVLSWMYAHLYSSAPAIPVRQTQEQFGNAPHARTSIEDDWKAINAQTSQHLEGYGWIDREHGLVRIPIQRAMDLIATQGLPARPGATPPAFRPPDEEKLPVIETETRQNAPSYGPN